MSRIASLTRTKWLSGIGVWPMTQSSCFVLSRRLPNVFQECTQAASFFSLDKLRRTPYYKSDHMSVTDKLICKSSKRRYLYLTYGAVGPCVGFQCLQTLFTFYTFIKSNMTTDVLLDPNGIYLFSFSVSLFGIWLFIAVNSLRLKSFLRIYYTEDEDNYTGIVLTSVLTTKKVVFNTSDIKTKQPNALLGELTGNYFIKGRPYYVVEGDFAKVADLNKMLGESPSRHQW